MNQATRDYARRFAAEAPRFSPEQRAIIRSIFISALTPVDKSQSSRGRRAA